MTMKKLSIILASVCDSIGSNLTCSNIIRQLEDDEINYEIIIIDNNSPDVDKNNLRYFLEHHTNFPIRFYNFDIRGTIPIHSFGNTMATGDYIMMPEPHLIFSPHYFRNMIETYEKYKSINVEMVFSLFNTVSMIKRGAEYIRETPMNLNNPFGLPHNCIMNIKEDKVFPIMSGAFCGMICSKDWMMKIGNMFPNSFVNAGGYVAEAILLGVSTWMFGGKVIVDCNQTIDHPAYKLPEGGSYKNANMSCSMLVSAYILGGEKYVTDLINHYGPFPDGYLDEVRTLSALDRKYVDENKFYSLEELCSNWKEICVL